tara:strand:- start:363 stop:794 length:432 start_codon:yes stop_codon:yes gene_type:complete
MGTLVFDNQERLIKIAANESDLNSQNIIIADCITNQPSDSDFENVRTNQSEATMSGGVVSFTNLDQLVFDQQSVLDDYIQQVITEINDLVKNDPSNSMVSQANSYKSTLEAFDTSTITYPLSGSWEKYCSDNSITFLHPLQIP